MQTYCQIMIRQLLSVSCPALLLSVVCASGQSVYSLPDSLVSLSDSAHIRELVLQEGLYLKSVMRYDEAAEVFASLLQKGSQDSKIISEIADCNYLDGNYSGARTFYMMLSMSAPDNIVAGIRLMQMSYRCGEYSESIRLGKSILQKDSIPAVCSRGCVQPYGTAGFGSCILPGGIAAQTPLSGCDRQDVRYTAFRGAV